MVNVVDKYKDRLPESYVKFISINKRFAHYLNDEFGYVDLWDLDLVNDLFDVICENHDNIGKDYFPIGSDGGMETICIKLTSPTKELFFIEGISTSDEKSVLFCKSFDELYDAVNVYLEDNNL